ncbi:MAG: type III-B CRISPR module-associated protein Cmr3 [Zetaproteobacteria bacterium CG_4_9_14_3_um_filter_49_83]|nr:MAG: type III-B CRISPR module-associated protein Cmr3 [Zetaproteobacteria bacterium CG17_big_fil_post_rev_8_21_14_2_50_50_13]PIV29122.1 MAG: type III-B CRISPR module-associated protein Cmr3 [Zetaproteobacteria bacterium CG02_land_8_20_14_3_00_50_9]PJA35508.1 MAG: type III-B CRISPR module-associated protein Cmr3 [Zetaproteobacteria bacterium CG_4_9_14_3_um_filter_49_83]
MKVWEFKPLDSCFFRGAKPFNSGEGGFLDSQFPPTAQTLAGVIRAAIGDAKGVDWEKFRSGQQPEIAELIGKESDHAGQLSFTGPYIFKAGERLYPMPLCLLHSEASGGWTRLIPSQETFKTDMDGMKHLPKPIKALPGAKPLENAWLDAGNMQLVLNGDEPASFIKESELFCGEARVGIERDNGKRMVNDGMLYFTRHVRLKEDISLGMVVSGADDVMPAGMVRLGGEGRMAHLKVADIVDSRLHGNDGKSDKFVLILLTHGDFLGKSEPALAGINMISACIGKAVREGGWDYKHNRPKPLKSLVPAGSCYFVEGDEQAIRALHGKHIGKRTAFGYGEIAVGIWREGEQQ